MAEGSREQNRQADAKRRELKPWRRWYHTARWHVMRDRQLGKISWCQPCKVEGRSRPATTANHKIPHRGDPELFWNGELESACDNCHNSFIQQAEARGFRSSIGEDGWPLDPAHPFNGKDLSGKDP
jgi:5-methylcytosine-specific restriction enzyme A